MRAFLKYLLYVLHFPKWGSESALLAKNVNLAREFDSGFTLLSLDIDLHLNCSTVGSKDKNWTNKLKND